MWPVSFLDGDTGESCESPSQKGKADMSLGMEDGGKPTEKALCSDTKAVTKGCKVLELDCG